MRHRRTTKSSIPRAELLLEEGPPVTAATGEAVPRAGTPLEGTFTVATRQPSRAVPSSNPWAIFRRTGEQLRVPLSPRPCRKGRIGVGHTVD
jgi:hypothetical protein